VPLSFGGRDTPNGKSTDDTPPPAQEFHGAAKLQKTTSSVYLSDRLNPTPRRTRFSRYLTLASLKSSIDLRPSAFASLRLLFGIL
jgi:hypothetical protein